MDHGYKHDRERYHGYKDQFTIYMMLFKRIVHKDNIYYYNYNTTSDTTRNI